MRSEVEKSWAPPRGAMKVALRKELAAHSRSGCCWLRVRFGLLVRIEVTPASLLAGGLRRLNPAHRAVSTPCSPES